MRQQTLPKTISLALATLMMVLTLGAIDQLAAHGSPAVQMAAQATQATQAAEATNATQTAKAATPAQRSAVAPRS
jgi:hypothetical protein